MKKKISAIALLAVICLTLAACGSGFSIEGKWKSVGSYGFGQAQPGATVIFDSNHCNFSSPRDTYTFIKDGDNYRLETTSSLSTDTLRFTVEVIDNDRIHVIYNGRTTELQRIQ